jgi:hypothetical protein
MKTFITLVILSLFIPVISACGQGASGGQNNQKIAAITGQVDVYYFHFERRCVTCVGVQKATEKVLKDNFGQELREGKIVYHEINLSDPASKGIAQKLNIGGQGLLVVNGGEKFDLTMQGFMFANRDYDRFKKELEGAIQGKKPGI